MTLATREKWAARVARWKASGLSATEFASQAGLNARSLTWWRWQLGSSALTTASESLARRSTRSRALTTTKKIARLTFVEVAAPVIAEPLEVILPSDVRIRVRSGFDAATLERLLAVLGARR